MPGKHVRFAKNNTLHTFSSPVPPLPALTHTSSPASSNSLPTPPDIPVPLPPVNHYQRTQHKYHSSSIQLHRLLEDSSSPEILYDVRLAPNTVGASRRVITPSDFNESATSPRISSMTIIHEYLPWSIHVTPSGYSRSRGMYYVTVWDVLKAIHSSLRTPITPGEYDRLGRGSKYQNRVKKAYEGRYRSSAAYQEEKMSGVRRVDFLVEYVKFTGLVPYNAEKGEFMLRTSK